MKILVTGGAGFIGMHTALGTNATLDLQPMAPGDVPDTHANMSQFEAWTQRTQQIRPQTGTERFVAWHHSYRRV